MEEVKVKATKAKGKGKGKGEKRQGNGSQSIGHTEKKSGKGGKGGGSKKNNGPNSQKSVENDVVAMFQTVQQGQSEGKREEALTGLCNLASTTIDMKVSKVIVANLVLLLEVENIETHLLQKGLFLLRRLNHNTPIQKVFHAALTQHFDQLVSILVTLLSRKDLTSVVFDEVVESLKVGLSPQWKDNVGVAHRLCTKFCEDIATIRSSYATQETHLEAEATQSEDFRSSNSKESDWQIIKVSLVGMSAICTACPTVLKEDVKHKEASEPEDVPILLLILTALVQARHDAVGISVDVLNQWRELACGLVKCFSDSLSKNELTVHYPLFATLLLRDGLCRGETKSSGKETVQDLTNQRRQRQVLLQHLSLFNKLSPRRLEQVALSLLFDVSPSSNDDVLYEVGTKHVKSCLHMLRSQAMNSAPIISFWRRGERSYRNAVFSYLSQRAVVSEDEKDVLLETFVAVSKTGSMKVYEMLVSEIVASAIVSQLPVECSTQAESSSFSEEGAYFSMAVLLHAFEQQNIYLEGATSILNLLLVSIPSPPGKFLDGFIPLLLCATRYVLGNVGGKSTKGKVAALLAKLPRQLASLGFSLIQSESSFNEEASLLDPLTTQVEQGLALIDSAFELGGDDCSSLSTDGIVPDLIQVLMHWLSKASSSSAPKKVRTLVIKTLSMLAQRHAISSQTSLSLVQVLLRQQFLTDEAQFDSMSMELVGYLAPSLLCLTPSNAVEAMSDSHRLQRRLLRWSSAHPEQCISQEDVKLTLNYLCTDNLDESFSFGQWCVDRFIVWTESVDPEHSKVTTVGAVQRNPVQAQLWMCWQTARMVCKNRLKTHFGAPKETFNAIEKALRPASSSSASSSASSSQLLSTPPGRASVKGGRIAVSGRGLEIHRPKALLQTRSSTAPSAAETAREAQHSVPIVRNLLKDRLLLIFIDALEKHVYHISNGTSRIGHRRDTKISDEKVKQSQSRDEKSVQDQEESTDSNEAEQKDHKEAESTDKEVSESRVFRSRALHSESLDAFVLPSPSPSCEAFFRNNKRVCEEWFARIRSLEIHLASYSLTSPDVLRHSMAKLTDLTRKMGAICAARDTEETVKSNRGNDLQKTWHDVESLLTSTAKSLSTLRDGEGISGLIEWHAGVKRQITATASTAKLTFDPEANPNVASRLLGYRLVSESRHEEVLALLQTLPMTGDCLTDTLATMGSLKQFEDVGKLIQAKDKKCTGEWWTWARAECGASKTSLGLLATWAALESEVGNQHTPPIVEPSDSMRKGEVACQKLLLAKKTNTVEQEVVSQASAALSPFIILDGVDPAANESMLRPDFEPWLTRCGLSSLVAMRPLPAAVSPVKLFKLDAKQHSPVPWMAFISVLRTSPNPNPNLLVAMQCAVATLSRKQGNFNLASSCIDHLKRNTQVLDVKLFCQYESACALFRFDEEKALSSMQDMVDMLAKENKVAKCPTVQALLQEDKPPTGSLNDVRHRWLVKGLLRLHEWSEGSSQVVTSAASELAVRVSPTSGKVWLKYAEWCYDQANQQKEKRNELLKVAVSAYRKFLCLSTDRRDLSVGVALRMVQMLVHQTSDQDEEWLPHISKQMALTPINHWVRVAPQLLARLGHPSPLVAEEVLLLLKRLGLVRPLSLVTQAVVAAGSKPQPKSETILHGRYTDLLKCLSDSEPELVKETEVFVHELNRVSYLWDEMWLALVMRVAPELESRVNTLNKDSLRLASHTGLSVDEKISLCLRRFQAVFSPLLSAVTLLAETTCMTSSPLEPCTPHEEWCLEVYKPMVAELVEAITKPSPPTFKESQEVSVESTPLPQPSNKSSKGAVTDFVCFECGEEGGRYPRWDECLSHVRMTHPEVETRRKDSKALIRDKCRAKARELKQTPPLSDKDNEIKSTGHKVTFEFEAPNAVWQSFLQLQRLLFQNAEKRTHESIAELSPRLSLLATSATHLTLPTYHAEDTMDMSGLRLAALDDTVTLITTKTRPKQLSMHSVDGKRRSYLLKGREDLHLDERVMQFLEVANDLVPDNLRAVRYAVVPLGAQSGIIEWVPRAVPLYQVYRRWQRADNRGKLLLQQQASSRNNTQAPDNSAQVVKEIPPLLAALCAWVAEGKGTRQTHELNMFYKAYPETKSLMRAAGGLRPFCDKYPSFIRFTHDKDSANQMIVLVPQSGNSNVKTTVEVASPVVMFHRELVRELEAQLGSRAEAVAKVAQYSKMPRSAWPKPLLKKIRQRLTEMAPRNLFERELWLSSTSSSDWYVKQGRYTRSLAFMSIVGYLLGLGDRHLDNILLDFSTGEVVHIDYGVCFDKGLGLKVPEIVSCRLTPLMLAALGPTAVEGRFRSSCEVTLQALRANQSLLLGLLEAFVYDPLLDWSNDVAMALQNRKHIDNSVTLSLFAARSAELLPGIAHRCDGLDTINQLLEALPLLRNGASSLVQALAVSAKLPQERAKVVTALSSAKQTMQKAVALKTEVMSDQNGLATISSQIQTLINRCEMITSKAENVISHLVNGSLVSSLEQCKEEARAVSALVHENSLCMEGYQLVQEGVKAAGKKQTLLSNAQLQAVKQLCQQADRSYEASLKECGDCMTECATSLENYKSALRACSLVNDEVPVREYVIIGLQYAVSEESKSKLARVSEKKDIEKRGNLHSLHDISAQEVTSILKSFDGVQKHVTEVNEITMLTDRSVDTLILDRSRQVEECSHIVMQEVIQLKGNKEEYVKECTSFKQGLSCHLLLMKQLFEMMSQPSGDIEDMSSRLNSLLELESQAWSMFHIQLEVVLDMPQSHVGEDRVQELYKSRRCEECNVQSDIQLVRIGVDACNYMVGSAVSASHTLSHLLEGLPIPKPDVGSACKQLLTTTSQGLAELAALNSITAYEVAKYNVGAEVLAYIASAQAHHLETDHLAAVLMEACLSDAQEAFHCHTEAKTLTAQELGQPSISLDWEKEFDNTELKKSISYRLNELTGQCRVIGLNAIDHCTQANELVTRVGVSFEKTEEVIKSLLPDESSYHLPPGFAALEQTKSVPTSLSQFIALLNKCAISLTEEVFGLLTCLDQGWMLSTNQNGAVKPCWRGRGVNVQWTKGKVQYSVNASQAPHDDVRLFARNISNDQSVEGRTLLAARMCEGAMHIVPQKLAWVTALSAVSKLHLKVLETTLISCGVDGVNVGVSKGTSLWCRGLQDLLFGCLEKKGKGMIPCSMMWYMTFLGEQCLIPLTERLSPVPSSSGLLSNTTHKQLYDNISIMSGWSEGLSLTGGCITSGWCKLSIKQSRYDDLVRSMEWLLEVERPRCKQLKPLLLGKAKRLVWLYGNTLVDGKYLEAFEQALEETDRHALTKKTLLSALESCLLKLSACSESAQTTITLTVDATGEVDKMLKVLREESGRPVGSRPLVDDQRVRQWHATMDTMKQRFQHAMAKCGNTASPNVSDAIKHVLEFERCIAGEVVSKTLTQSADDRLKLLQAAYDHEKAFGNRKSEIATEINEATRTMSTYQQSLIEVEQKRLKAANDLGLATVTLLPIVAQVIKYMISLAEVLFQQPLPLSNKPKPNGASTWVSAEGSFSEVKQIAKHACRSLSTSDQKTDGQKALLAQVNDLVTTAESAQKCEEMLAKLIKSVEAHLRTLPDILRPPKGTGSSLSTWKTQTWAIDMNAQKHDKPLSDNSLLMKLSKLTDETEASAVALMEKARPALKFAQQFVNFLDSDSSEALDMLQGVVAQEGVWLLTRKQLSQVSDSAQHAVNDDSLRSSGVVAEEDEEEEGDVSEEEEEEEEDVALKAGVVVDEQERNEFAVGVLERVSDRLAGRMAQGAEQVNDVPSQVSWLISQSTNADNLCQMYEGWASWI